MYPVLPGDGLEVAEALECGVAESAVLGDGDGVAGLLAFLVENGDRDGHDLGGEGVFRPGLGAELLAAQAEGVGVVAGDVPLLGDALGSRTAR